MIDKVPSVKDFKEIVAKEENSFKDLCTSWRDEIKCNFDENKKDLIPEDVVGDINVAIGNYF